MVFDYTQMERPVSKYFSLNISDVFFQYIPYLIII